MKQGKYSLYLYQEAAYNLQESELEDRVGMNSATCQSSNPNTRCYSVIFSLKTRDLGQQCRELERTKCSLPGRKWELSWWMG